MIRKSFIPIVIFVAAVFALGVVFLIGRIASTSRVDLLGLQGRGLFGQPCEGSNVGKLAMFPLDPDDVELIVPMGRVQDSHVTPTDHQYVIPKGTISTSIVTSNPRMYDLKAPADGYIISIELFKEPIERAYRGGEYADNYLVLFEHSCNWYTRLIHIDTLSDKVLANFEFKNPNDQHPYASTRIAVKEGETIGTVGPHSFDFQIMDATSKDPNVISPDNIDHFSSYTVDTFDYITNALKEKLLSKNLRSKPPLGGKVGYDIEGNLIGNWFRVGRDKDNKEEYWTDELSIVYDHIDESQIRVSFGNYDGYSKAFGVGGNAPSPASVDKNSGMVKYELMRFDYYDAQGNRWDEIHFAQNLVARNTGEKRGVVVFELQNDRTLKVEVFPRATSAGQVYGFTPNAVLYER